MSMILNLLLPKRRRINLRACSPAREDFLYLVETYMKDNGIDQADLNCSTSELLSLYESYEDEKIQKLLKAGNDSLPDIELPNYK